MTSTLTIGTFSPGVHSRSPLSSHFKKNHCLLCVCCRSADSLRGAATPDGADAEITERISLGMVRSYTKQHCHGLCFFAKPFVCSELVLAPQSLPGEYLCLQQWFALRLAIPAARIQPGRRCRDEPWSAARAVGVAGAEGQRKISSTASEPKD